MERHTLSGHPSQVEDDIRHYRMNNKRVQVVHEHQVSHGYAVAVIEVTPYTAEEEQEHHIYGNPDHEEYLLSDDYIHDCRSEQYDWIRRENEGMQNDY